MSEEFESSSIEPKFTSFIPLTILLSGVILWLGYQDIELNKQRSALNQNFQNAMPTIGEAQNISQRYVSLMKDLVNTAKDDEAAKNIVNDAIKAGLIKVQPNAAGTAAGTDTSTPASTDTATKP
jgi:hypothetical protein